MNTITTWDGERREFQNFGDFANTENKMRENGAHFMSYYDNKGNTHLCEFRIIRGGVACLMLHNDLGDKDVYDCAGNLSHDVYKAAADIVKYERWDEFAGWSL